MTDSAFKEIQELECKNALTGQERARLKTLKRTIKKEQAAENTAKTNVFATTPTTKLQPLPIRFSKGERAGLTNLANNIKTDNPELVIEELGSLRDINETKLVRAAVYLLQETSTEKIIEAIKNVKINMVR